MINNTNLIVTCLQRNKTFKVKVFKYWSSKNNSDHYYAYDFVALFIIF